MSDKALQNFRKGLSVENFKNARTINENDKETIEEL